MRLLKNHKKCRILILISLFLSCDRASQPTRYEKHPTPSGKITTSSSSQKFSGYHGSRELFSINAPKWKNGHRGAISITYDAPWGINPVFSLATDAAIQRGLKMDVEIVSEKLLFYSRFPIIAKMRTELIPNGIGVFGHGHSHIDHDALGFHDAYRSFQHNFNLMRKWGLNPKVYAYPLFAGREQRTQAANRQAGFIAARGGTEDPDSYYLCETEPCKPDSWFNLPSVIMGSANSRHISNHNRLLPILHETLSRRAWTILTYHSIGNPDGWGYYEYNEFLKDLDFIKNNDFWSGNFAAVTSYAIQRKGLQIQIGRYFGRAFPKQFEIYIGDGLDNTIYSEPLTLDFSFDESLSVQSVRIQPSPTVGDTIFTVDQNRLRLHVVPRERQYTLSFIF